MIDHLHRQVLLGEPPGKAMKVLTSSLKYNIPYSTEIKRHRRLRKGAWQDKLYDNPQCNASRRGSSEGWIGTSPGCRPRFMHGARVASEPTAAGARAAALADRYRPMLECPDFLPTNRIASQIQIPTGQLVPCAEPQSICNAASYGRIGRGLQKRDI
jgi:hypothetical protein